MAKTPNPNLWYEGKPCKLGHSGTRYISSGACVECMTLYHSPYQIKKRQQYRQLNPLQRPLEFHGASRNREYQSWLAMKRRCYDPNNQDFARYGGRGIKVCKQWQDSFATFLKDMGPCPPGMTLDRVNNNGHYRPSNCRWATRKTQGRNSTWPKMTLKQARLIKALYRKGANRHNTGNIAELAERFGITRKMIHDVVQGKTWRE